MIGPEDMTLTRLTRDLDRAAAYADTPREQALKSLLLDLQRLSAVES